MRIRRRSPNCVSRPLASGFTLLEVVLSLALSILLLGAIFSAMDQSWRLSAGGREEMERSQLARALFNQIASDVRSIAFVPPPPPDDEESSSSGTSGSSGSSNSGSSNSSSNNSSSSSSSSSSTSSSVQPISLTSIGIRGDAQQIEMHISRPRRDLDFTPGLDGSKQQTHFSDLVAVQYYLGTLATSSGMSGLIRTEGDRLAILTMESSQGNASTMFQRQLLAPEVAQLSFRYFDGVIWYPYWVSGGPTAPPPTDSGSSGNSSTSTSGSSNSSNNSSNSSSTSNSSTTTSMTVTSANSTTGMGRLPRAIEVTIGLTPPHVTNGPALRVGFSSSTNVFRTVIVLPISDPLPPEFVP